MMSVGIIEIIIIAVIGLFVLALMVGLVVLFFSARRGTPDLSTSLKKCPYCAELIKKEATVCRFCGRDQPAQNAS